MKLVKLQILFPAVIIAQYKTNELAKSIIKSLKTGQSLEEFENLDFQNPKVINDFRQVLSRIDINNNKQLSNAELLFWNFVSATQDDSDFPDDFIAYNFKQADDDNNNFIDFNEMLDFEFKATDDRSTFILKSNKEYNRNVAKWTSSNFDYKTRYKALEESNPEKFRENNFMLDEIAYKNYNLPLKNKSQAKLFKEEAILRADHDEDGKVSLKEHLVQDWGKQPSGVARAFVEIYHKYNAHKTGEMRPDTAAAPGTLDEETMGERKMTEKFKIAMREFIDEEFKNFGLLDLDGNEELNGEEVYYWLDIDSFKTAGYLNDEIFNELDKDRENGDEISFEEFLELFSDRQQDLEIKDEL